MTALSEMRSQCAWCKKVLRDPRPDAGDRQPVTHGVCASCLDELTRPLGTDLARFLDTLDTPVLLVDRAHRIHLRNREAHRRRVRRAPASNPEPETVGHVFECAHANQPGGCGNTIHCSGCAIRRAIRTTHRTGEPVVREPAKVKQEDREARLLITTAKAGSAVLLQIDEAVPA